MFKFVKCMYDINQRVSSCDKRGPPSSFSLRSSLVVDDPSVDRVIFGYLAKSSIEIEFVGFGQDTLTGFQETFRHVISDRRRKVLTELLVPSEVPAWFVHFFLAYK